MSESLKDKTVKGTAWSAIDSVASQGIHFIVSIVLARLLSPSEYGVIGIITIFITVFNGIVDSGFNRALIRKHDAKEIDYSITNLFFSIVLAGVLFLCAPFIADIFERPIELTEVPEVGCLGAAMCAGIGAGLYKDAFEAAEKCVHVRETYTPNPSVFEMYRESFDKWLKCLEICNSDIYN